MNLRFSLVTVAFLLASQPSSAQQIKEVRGSADTPVLPEDLFGLAPGTWAFARQLWQGNEPCTPDECEAGYTIGDLVISVERHRTSLLIVAGFRNCKSVAWNEYEIGKRASDRDNKTMRKRLSKTVDTSAKYCKVPAPAIVPLDTRQLFPIR